MSQIKKENKVIFKNKESGREHELAYIHGTTFWFNNHEELFVVDVETGYATPITAKRALEVVLRRKEMKSDLCCVCQDKPHKTNPGALQVKGHEDNYLDKYFQK